MRLGRTDVVEGVGEDVHSVEAFGDVHSGLSPVDRGRQVQGEHAQLGQVAVRHRQLRTFAEVGRLEDRHGRLPVPFGGRAVTQEPGQPGQPAQRVALTEPVTRGRPVRQRELLRGDRGRRGRRSGSARRRGVPGDRPPPARQRRAANRRARAYWAAASRCAPRAAARPAAGTAWASTAAASPAPSAWWTSRAWSTAVSGRANSAASARRCRSIRRPRLDRPLDGQPGQLVPELQPVRPGPQHAGLDAGVDVLGRPG